MSDINAAPSSTEPSNEAAKTDMQEAGTAAVGEATGILAIPSDSGSDASTAASNITSMTASTADAGAATGTTSIDAPAVAASGESGSTSADASLTSATSTDGPLTSTSTDTEMAIADASNGSTEDPNAGASPAAGQSASDTASSVQGASQEGGIAVGTWPSKTNFITHEELIAMRVELPAARARIAELEQQVTDEQERVIKWQSMYNAACAAKPHAESLLQKLEAGEAIVLGDLQSRLRAFVDAL